MSAINTVSPEIMELAKSVGKDQGNNWDFTRSSVQSFVDMIDTISDEDLVKMSRLASKMSKHADVCQDMGYGEKKDGFDNNGLVLFFLWGFITDEMRQDFNAIERNFFENCPERDSFTPDYLDADWLGRKFGYYVVHGQRVLTSILKGAFLNNQYCLNLIKVLYKTYHKKEYSVLKRYATICYSDLLDLSQDEKGLSIMTLSRVLIMAPFFGINMAQECDYFFHLLDNEGTKVKQEESGYEDSCLTSKEWDEVVQAAETWHLQQQKLDERIIGGDLTVPEGDVFEYIKKVFVDNGYEPDFFGYCCKRYEENVQNKNIPIEALATVKILYPNFQLTPEQSSIYMMLYHLAVIIMDEADYISTITENSLLEYPPVSKKGDKALMSVLTAMPDPEESKQRKMICEQKANQERPKDEAEPTEINLEEEIASLKERLKQAEQERDHFARTCQNEKESRQKMERELAKAKENQVELLTLREFAYEITKEDTPAAELDPITVEDMKNEIAEKSITIIGGNPNWVKKLRLIFPKWKFIAPTVSNSVMRLSILNSEHVIFFTDVLGHSNYAKFMIALQIHKIPFSYLHGVNIQRNISDIYKLTKGKQKDY